MESSQLASGQQAQVRGRGAQAVGSAEGPWGWRRLGGIETPRPSQALWGPSSPPWEPGTPCLQAQTVCCPSQVAPPFRLPWGLDLLETYSAHQNPREVDWPGSMRPLIGLALGMGAPWLASSLHISLKASRLQGLC